MLLEDPSVALEFLIKYKYLVLFPLAFFEGPIVALAVGFLLSIGVLSIVPSIILLVLGDVVPDTMYYYIGRFGKKKRFAEKRLELLKDLWGRHPRKTMFFSKLAYGLSIPFLISAGMIGMPYWTFIERAVPVTLFQYGSLMAVGYFFGSSYESATKYVSEVGIVMAILLIVFVTGFWYMKSYASKQIKTMEEDIQAK